MKVYLFTDDFLDDDELNAIASYMAKNGGDIINDQAYFYNRQLSQQFNDALVKSGVPKPIRRRTRYKSDNPITDDDIINLARYLNISAHNLNKIMDL